MTNVSILFLVVHSQNKPLTPHITVPKKRYTPTEWIANFLAADLEAYEADQLARGANDEPLDEWDSSGMPGGDDFYADGDLWIDDELLEALVILGLAATLAFLVYWRQQRVMRTRRERAEALARAQEQGGVWGVGGGVLEQPQVPHFNAVAAPAAADGGDRGLFPVPGDPEFMNWAVGGIGH